RARGWGLQTPVDVLGPSESCFPVPYFRVLGPESLEVPGMDLRQCGPQEWCWLVSTVSWLVLVERLLDLSSVAARLRDSPVWFVWVSTYHRNSVDLPNRIYHRLLTPVDGILGTIHDQSEMHGLLRELIKHILGSIGDPIQLPQPEADGVVCWVHVLCIVQCGSHPAQHPNQPLCFHMDPLNVAAGGSGCFRRQTRNV
ncbi:hypothetical protein Taro_029586, partial [Colocasia esculenta]|nr:hypothetical protein [Colocasia esculenta]